MPPDHGSLGRYPAATGLPNISINIAQLGGLVLLGSILGKLAGPGAVCVAAALVIALPAARPPPRCRGVIASVRDDLATGWAFAREDRPSRHALAHLALTRALVPHWPEPLPPRALSGHTGHGRASRELVGQARL
jgi:hypothetical protein